jgi:TonB family protein
MRKITFTIILFLIFGFSQQSSLLAQSGRVMGRVVDAAGQPIKGVTVYISGEGGTSAGISNPQGYYMMLGVTPGNYEVRINGGGLGKYESKVVVAANSTTRLDAKLGGGEATVAEVSVRKNIPADKPNKVVKLKSEEQVEAKSAQGQGASPAASEAAKKETEAAKKEAEVAAQEKLATEQESNFVELPETPIQVEGGETAIQRLVKYPPIAVKMKMEGHIVAKVIVNADGAVGQVIFLKSANEVLDGEVLRVLNEEAKFTPAQQNGKPVASSIVIPITFKKPK